MCVLIEISIRGLEPLFRQPLTLAVLHLTISISDCLY